MSTKSRSDPCVSEGETGGTNTRRRSLNDFLLEQLRKPNYEQSERMWSQFPLKCLHCDMTFIHQLHLHAHVQIHLTSSRVQCEQCSEQFENGLTLQDHLEWAHAPNRAFPVEYSLSEHISYCVPSFPVVYAPPPPPMAFTNMGMPLLPSMPRDSSQPVTHMPANLPPSPASSSTDPGSDSALMPPPPSSMERLMAKDINCEHCGKKFLYKCNLARHLSAIHNERTLKTAGQSAGRSPRSPFKVGPAEVFPTEKKEVVWMKCGFCDRSFTQKSSLVLHQQVHKGTEPFRCSMCHGVKFATLAKMDAHMLKHRRRAEHRRQNRAKACKVGKVSKV